MKSKQSEEAATYKEINSYNFKLQNIFEPSSVQDLNLLVGTMCPSFPREFNSSYVLIERNIIHTSSPDVNPWLFSVRFIFLVSLFREMKV